MTKTSAGGIIATAEGLQQFDTDGSPITVGMDADTSRSLTRAFKTVGEETRPTPASGEKGRPSDS